MALRAALKNEEWYKRPVDNRKWDEDRFQHALRQTLDQWPDLGLELEEMLSYQRSLPSERRARDAFLKAEREGTTLAMPRAGTVFVEDMLAHFKHVPEADGIIMLPDTATKKGDFKQAGAGLEECRKSGQSLLNGYPIVNYPLKVSRELCESIDRPVQISASTTAANLATMAAVAAGATEMLVGSFAFLVEGSPFEPVPCIVGSQLIGRMVGWLEERGVSVVRSFNGVPNGAFVPPSIEIASFVLDCLMAAQQGAKYFSPHYHPSDSLVADVAGLRMVRVLCDSYLRKFGFNDTKVFPASVMYQAAFSRDRSQAMARICLDAMSASLGRATVMRIKASDEAYGCPRKESNLESVRAVQYVIKATRTQHLPESNELDLEMRMIEKETRAIVDRTLELGDGDPAIGTVRAVQAGVIDFPYAPSPYNPNKAFVLRDSAGAPRYLRKGELPFSKEIMEFHEQKLADRRGKGGKSDWDLIAEDFKSVII